MLNTDFPKFCGFVLEAHAEKHQDKKYVGKIKFDSSAQSSNAYIIPKKETPAPKKEVKAKTVRVSREDTFVSAKNEEKPAAKKTEAPTK